MEGGVYGRGHAWWWERVHGEGDMVGGGAWKGGVCGRGHAWWWEGVHGEGDMVGGVHGRRVCMAEGMHGGGRGCMVRETW